MNRFQAAGLRIRRDNLIRDGCAEEIYARLTVPEGAVQGDVFHSEFYRITADQDRGDDGKAACWMVLDPQI